MNKSEMMTDLNLRRKPFYLKDEDIDWVEAALASMTLEEKVGQLFCLLGMSPDPDDYSGILKVFAPGGIMFRPGPSDEIRGIHRFLQENSKVPMLVSANLETGGNGIITDGTDFGAHMQVAATDDEAMAHTLGKISGTEGRCVGCNWTFAPTVDIDYSFLNPITNTRTFGSNPDRVAAMARAYMQGAREAGLAACMKHWPGDGVDDRDQHLVTTINSLSTEQWDQTFGKLFKVLIDSGIPSVMAGHIMLPEYSRKLVPGIEDKDIMPATLAPEILNDLLREKLGFNGLIISDASIMAGFTLMMERKKAIPAAIAAGNDMFLFQKCLPEDFGYMMKGVEEGIITPARLDEAVTRILALKASIGLHRQQKAGNLIPDDASFREVLGCTEHIKAARICADKAVTLVKDTQKLLPISPEQHKRVILFPLGDEPGMFAPPEATGRLPEFRRLLENEGFEVEVFDRDNVAVESMFASVDEFLARYDLAVYFANIATASNQTVTRITWAWPLGADIPWFNEEKTLPCLFVSVANPYHLYDLPRIKTFINAYNSSSVVLEAVIDKIMGRSEFKGKNPVDPFCGLWDAKL